MAEQKSFSWTDAVQQRNEVRDLHLGNANLVHAAAERMYQDTQAFVGLNVDACERLMILNMFKTGIFTCRHVHTCLELIELQWPTNQPHVPELCLAAKLLHQPYEDFNADGLIDPAGEYSSSPELMRDTLLYAVIRTFGPFASSTEDGHRALVAEFNEVHEKKNRAMSPIEFVRRMGVLPEDLIRQEEGNVFGHPTKYLRRPLTVNWHVDDPVDIHEARESLEFDRAHAASVVYASAMHAVPNFEGMLVGTRRVREDQPVVYTTGLIDQIMAMAGLGDHIDGSANPSATCFMHCAKVHRIPALRAGSWPVVRDVPRQLIVGPVQPKAWWISMTPAERASVAPIVAPMEDEVEANAAMGDEARVELSRVQLAAAASSSSSSSSAASSSSHKRRHDEM